MDSPKLRERLINSGYGTDNSDVKNGYQIQKVYLQP
jgi:hypothetical protein